MISSGKRKLIALQEPSLYLSRGRLIDFPIKFCREVSGICLKYLCFKKMYCACNFENSRFIREVGSNSKILIKIIKLIKSVSRKGCDDKGRVVRNPESDPLVSPPRSRPGTRDGVFLQGVGGDGERHRPGHRLDHGGDVRERPGR